MDVLSIRKPAASDKFGLHEYGDEPLNLGKYSRRFPCRNMTASSPGDFDVRYNPADHHRQGECL
jgi:hypothetical protein